jgi:DNA-binding LytR/AlgR family response regulator
MQEECMRGDAQQLSRDFHEPAATPQDIYGNAGGCRCGQPWLVAEKSHRLYFIAASDIDYIEAYGNYVRVHVGENEYVRRDTLAHLAPHLRGSGFYRVRRSTLLNLRRVAFAERMGEGALVFTLTSGVRLTSRSHFRFPDLLKG